MCQGSRPDIWREIQQIVGIWKAGQTDKTGEEKVEKRSQRLRNGTADNRWYNDAKHLFICKHMMQASKHADDICAFVLEPVEADQHLLQQDALAHQEIL